MLYSVQAVTANGVALVLLLYLLLGLRKLYNRDRAGQRVFVAMIALNMFLCALEPVTIMINGMLFPGALRINTVINVLLYLGNTLFSALWTAYADRRSHRQLPRWEYLKYIPAGLTMLAALANLFTPVFFYLTPQNVYVRTGWYLATFTVSYFYLIWGTVTAYHSARRRERYLILPALQFMAPVFTASLLQYCLPGTSLLWVGTAIGLTEAYIAMLDEGSAIDALSGAYSRHRLNEDLSQLQAYFRGRRLAGIMLDIDNFKNINDRYGHITGDKVIRRVGRLLRSTVGSRGAVYRFGGDEFTILLNVNQPEEAQAMLERIHQAAAKAKDAEQTAYRLSFSGGWAIYDPGERASEFVNRMDKALYDDKKSKMLRLAGSQELGEDYQVSPERNVILIIDDDFINRELMKNAFPARYRIAEAEDGVQGLRQVEALDGSLCAILLDQEMPQMTGTELLKILKERGITQSVPTFLVTANDEYDVARAAYAMGVIDVITKPVVPFVILRRVQSVLELFQARQTLQAQQTR